MDSSFRRARRATLSGTCFALPVRNRSSVGWSANDLITQKCNESRDTCQRLESDVRLRRASPGWISMTLDTGRSVALVGVGLTWTTNRPERLAAPELSHQCEPARDARRPSEANAHRRTRIHKRNRGSTTGVGPAMETLAQDVRFAVRSLAKSPGFALVAIITLALGIGVNSAVVSVVNAILYRPLPVHAPTELVELYGKQESESSFGTHSYLNYLSYREANSTLTDLIAYSNFMANLVVEGSAQLAVGELVSNNYFTGLGVRPALGRFFTPEEAAPIGGATYVVLSDRFWRTRYNAAPNVIGRTLRMNGTIYTIVGVADPSFGGMIPGVTTQMWIPVNNGRAGRAVRQSARAGADAGDLAL